MQVLIAGAGIGGLTLALCLLRQGLKVTIYERSHTLEEVGAGIQIGPNGAKVFAALGLLHELEQVAFKPQAAEMRMGDTTGRVIFSLPLGVQCEQRYHAPYFNIHRADLQRILVNAVQHQAPNVIQLGYELKDIVQDKHGVEVFFTNGTSAKGNILIGADGVRSAVRKLLFNIEDGQFTGMAAWRMTVPSARLPKNLVPPNATVWVGKGQHAVTYYVRGGQLVNLVGIVEQDHWPYDDWTCQGNKQDLVNAYKNWHPIIKGILEAGDDTEYYQWALRELPPLTHWFKERVCLLGDACHAMLPFMAQGAVMAIEDAWVLAQKIAIFPNNPSQAFSHYEKERKPRITKVQATSRRNGQLYHQHSSAGQMLFYSPLWLASRLTPNFFATQLDWLFAEDVTT
jgi:salicylate hydroxylase